MNTVDTSVSHTASGLTRMNPRTQARCPRCHRVGDLTPDSIVCQRCLNTADPRVIVAVTVTVTVTEGGH